MTKFIWQYFENKPFSSEVEKQAGSTLLAQMLANRGIDTPQKVQKFLNPKDVEFFDYKLFKDMTKAVERITLAIKNQETIMIYGDFDCDGVTSTALLFKTLTHLGAKVGCYIPDRKTEGHGLNSKAVCEIISKKKSKLIITVDNGISSVKEVKLAKTFGADVIITDHHEAPEELPDAFAIINPKSPFSLDDSLSIAEIEDIQSLAGVGIAYKLSEALLDYYKKNEFAEEILYLAAIGTIADIVPLLEQNRAIVQRGIESIRQINPKWLRKLLNSKDLTLENLNPNSIAFIIAPRINSAGRLEHANIALELLVSDDEERIDFCVKQLNDLNQIRQQVSETIFMESQHKIENELDLNKNKAIVLSNKDWHVGIIGIVASKIIEKYYRPTFMISVDSEANVAKCSARSIKGLNMYEVLNCFSEKFEHFGGHAQAGGFAIDLNKVNLEEFIENLNEYVNEILDEEMLKPSLNIDLDIKAEDLTIEFIENLNKMEPFGASNPACLFSVSNLVLKQYMTMGNNSHLKMLFSDAKNNILETVWWQVNDYDIDLSDVANIAFSPKINTFNDKTSIQLELKDVKVLNKKVVEEEKTLSKNEEKKFVLLDHRNKQNVFKALNNYLKTNDSEIKVFAENKDIIEKMNDYPEIKNRIFNRTEILNSFELIFLDYPCNLGMFNEFFKQSCLKKLHIMPYDQKAVDVDDFIKKLSGMLKYAHSKKNGIVELSVLAINLSTTREAIKACLELLEKAGVISIINLKENDLEFNFLQGQSLNKISSFGEYKILENKLNEIDSFRQKLSAEDVSEIKNIIFKLLK